MFKTNSHYALNKKNPDAIVYQSVTGEITYITRESCASEEEFLLFKSWSDENYHLEDNQDVDEDRHTIALESLAEAALAVPSPEMGMLAALQRSEERISAVAMVAQIREELTETQFRRLWMYCVNGMREAEIAQKEGVGQRRISTSISAAKEKIKNFSKI